MVRFSNSSKVVPIIFIILRVTSHRLPTRVFDCAEGVSSIFGNVEQILNFSKDLLKELRLSNEELKPIGTTFIKKANLFEVYSTYVINYPKGLRR